MILPRVVQNVLRNCRIRRSPPRIPRGTCGGSLRKLETRRSAAEVGSNPARSNCAGSRPASLKRPAINRQSVNVSSPPKASGSGSTEAESVCSLEPVEDHVEGKRAPTRSNPDGRGRGDSKNGEGKLRGQRGRRRQQNAVRASRHDPQVATFSQPREAVGGTPTATSWPLRMGAFVVGSGWLAVESGVRADPRWSVVQVPRTRWPFECHPAAVPHDGACLTALRQGAENDCVRPGSTPGRPIRV